MCSVLQIAYLFEYAMRKAGKKDDDQINQQGGKGKMKERYEKMRLSIKE